MIKIAFGSVPKDGGTYTFYRNLRPALKQYDINLLCVTVGRREADLIEQAYVDDGCILLADGTDNVKKQAIEFEKWCQSESIDIVIAINSVAILSALPYLPKHIRVVSRCANAFEEGYRVTLSGRDRLMSIVAITPRLQTDLIEKYKVNPQTISLIPNGIDPTPFIHVSKNKAEYSSGSPIQLGFLGRLEHRQKGVLYIPKVVEELKRLDVPFHLRIAGKGVHRAVLEQELASYIDSGEVEFLGSIPKQEVPHFLASTDIFLFTSHFEGCPNALLEAMTSGCVPVVFRIDGITDFVVEHGKTGFIAEMADHKTFAHYIAQMVFTPSTLTETAAAARASANERFSASLAAQKYADLFHEVMQLPLPDYHPLPWSQFQVDPVYRNRWTNLLPSSLKRVGKRLLARRSSVTCS